MAGGGATPRKMQVRRRARPMHRAQGGAVQGRLRGHIPTMCRGSGGGPMGRIGNFVGEADFPNAFRDVLLEWLAERPLREKRSPTLAVVATSNWAQQTSLSLCQLYAVMSDLERFLSAPIRISGMLRASEYMRHAVPPQKLFCREIYLRLNYGSNHE